MMQGVYHSMQPPWKGWRLPLGREMTSPRGGAGSEPPPPTRSFTWGWKSTQAAAPCPPPLIPETKAKFSGEGEMGKLRRTLIQALLRVAHL